MNDFVVREDKATGSFEWNRPSRCDCGAAREVIESVRLGGEVRRRYPGRLLEPCTCPRCIGCGRRMAPALPHPTCDNLDCWAVGVWQLEPA